MAWRKNLNLYKENFGRFFSEVAFQANKDTEWTENQACPGAFSAKRQLLLLLQAVNSEKTTKQT